MYLIQQESAFFMSSFLCPLFYVLFFLNLGDVNRLFHPIAEGCTLRSARSNMRKTTNERVGSEVQYGPRLVGDILSEMLSSDSPLAMGYRQHLASKKSDAEKGGRA